MLEKMKNWVKNNKLAAILLLIVVYLLLSSGSNLFGMNMLGTTSRMKGIQPQMAIDYDESATRSFGAVDGMAPIVEPEMTPTATAGLDRIVVQSSNLSLVVKNVREVGDRIINFSEEKGGFMVNASYNQPDTSPFATITVRVPTKDFGEALQYFRSLSIKVANENLVGRDVTDQYVDIEERLSTLKKTKSKFETILDQATEIEDILQVQRELIYLQDQIDSYTGRLEAIQEEADYTKMTVYLSTDELSLPYTPDNKFRPGVIFKLAVRSLLNTFVGIGEKLIWAGVYSVIWGPVLLIYLGYKRRRSNRLRQNTPPKE